MADLASSDVTITLIKNRILRGSPVQQRRNLVKIAFGDGALTYPALGVPLPAASAFGLIQVLDYLIILDNNDGVGIIWKFDYEGKKLRAWRSAGFTPAGTVAAPVFTGTALGTHVHDMKYIGGITATEPVAIAGGDTLGKNAATDRTIAGSASATKGGVVAVGAGTPAGTNDTPAFTGTAVAAASLIEHTNAAVAAQVLYAEAVGY